MKIILERLNNTLYMAEERRLIEITQSEEQRKERLKKNEQSFRDQEDNIKHGRLEVEKWTEKK